LIKIESLGPDNLSQYPPPNEEYFLMTFFGFLVVGFYFMGNSGETSAPVRQGPLYSPLPGTDGRDATPRPA
jgi:hypothetical protein